jgi:uncharacterized protein YutE (UPF0331/DUF86 family)
MDTKEIYLKRIDDLLATKPNAQHDGSAIAKVYAGAISIASSLYGPDSAQVKAIETRSVDFSKWAQDDRERYFINELHGMLTNIRDEIQSGFVLSLQTVAKGEVLADFIVMAKQTLDEGSKDVAAVLACAALEDTLKRFAEHNGLETYEKSMSEVINALKSKGLLKGPRGKVLESFVSVRNKAFHAQWDSIDTTEIHSVVAFVQEFLTTEFVTSFA